MKISELQFQYPEDLVAIAPQRPSRVAWIAASAPPEEITISELCHRIPTGDLLILNDTKVLHRRVFAGDLEILFLKPLSADLCTWQVLMPAKKLKLGEQIRLPMGAVMTLKEKGRPQIVQLDRVISEQEFEHFAELPLPPYIQKARGHRHNSAQDEEWYQTAWAEKPGSLAAPTASLHFSDRDLQDLTRRGVHILKVTLHVGLGTFLPVTTEDLNDHPMHYEEIQIRREDWQEILKAKSDGRKIWALGTTAVRTLESVACGLVQENEQGFQGETNLLIQPGYDWKIVDRVLTNFHQPESTLLALVAGFVGLSRTLQVYSWAIQKRFRLFSYGDISVWLRD
jgi:S-adenosylmethionine:tRNA ribosyltransferase-isomerase